MGYKAFKVIKTEKDVIGNIIHNVHTPKTEKFAVTISPSGGIEAIYDKTRNQ
jgi:hypothetical protein